MTRRLGAGLALLLVTGGCLLGARDEAIPDPSTCTNAPGDASIAEAAIGSPPGVFVALQEGAATYVAEDESGNEWVALRAAWRGAGAPACAHVRIALRDPADDSEIAHYSGELTSSPQSEWRVSDEVYFRTEPLPARVVAVVEVYGVVSRTTVRVGGYVPPDDDGGP